MKYNKGAADSGLIYILGVIGAAVFYLQNAGTATLVLMGILKSLVWPAMLVYKLLG